MKYVVLFLSAIALSAPAIAAPKADAAKTDAAGVKITGLEARFFYEGTGVLSDNIAPPATFHAWNSVIGAGDARQPANDLLVVVTLSRVAGEANVNGPLTIVAARENGRVIAKRSFKSLFFKNGKLAKAMLVPDVACAGKIMIKAAFGAERRLTNLELNCGE